MVFEGLKQDIKHGADKAKDKMEEQSKHHEGNKMEAQAKEKCHEANKKMHEAGEKCNDKAGEACKNLEGKQC